MTEIKSLEGRSIHNLTKLAEQELDELIRQLNNCTYGYARPSYQLLLELAHGARQTVSAIHQSPYRYKP